MDRDVNENDVHLANYNFDKPIKISYIFEDNDSDETETVENLPLPEKPAQYSSPQNNNHNNCANKPLNKTLDSDETETVENLPLPEKPVQYSSQNNNHDNSANKPLNRTLLDNNCYSNVGFDDMEIGLNIDNDSRTKAKENYNGGVQKQQTVISYANSNPETPLGEMRNINNRILDYSYLINNDNTQYSYLLDTVSENLIMILKYYRYYNMQLAKDHTAREKYLNRKLHYYNQSYNALIAVFLPQEHNYVFLRNFIKRTIDIANRKQRCHINTMLISSLETWLSDMIQWAKQTRYMEKRNNQLHQSNRPPPPPYNINSDNTRQMNTQAAVSLGLSGPTLTSASYSVSNTYARPMNRPVSFLSSNLAVQPPFYSISNTSTQQPMRRPPPSSIPTTIPHLPATSNSFSRVNPKQTNGILPSVSLVPSDLPLSRSSSPNNSNINTQQTMRRLPPSSLAKSDPFLTSALNSFSNANAQQLQNSISITVPHLPPTSNSFSSVNSKQTHGRLPSVSLVPSDLPLPRPSSHNNSNINTQQTMRRLQPTSLAKSDPYLTSALNSFSAANAQQLHSALRPVSLISSILPEPRSSSQNSSSIDTRQPKNSPPPVSLIPSELPEPTTMYSISNVDTLQPMTRTSVPVVQVPVPPASSNITTNSNTNAGIPANNDNTICLFSTGLPGSEISISIDAEIAKIVNEANSIKKVVQKRNHNGASKRQKTNDIESPIMVHTSTFFPPMQNQVQQNNHNCDSSKQLTTASNANRANTTVEPNINNNFNQLNPGRQQNVVEYDCNKCQTPLLSRSESRDSGFGSPVLNTLLTLNDNKTVYQHCTDNQDFTPEITHVTSMHPDAVFITSGTCKICGATTKNKCIACYKEYYCGSECQAVDWPFHMQVCTPR